MSELASSESKLIGPILSSPDEGYVFDQMEGAIDTALFLAPLDIPIAIIGSRGTGKGFIARLIHDARDGEGNQFAILDCREVLGNLIRIFIFVGSFWKIGQRYVPH